MPRRFNPNDDVQLAQLREAMEDSRKQLQPFRENFRDMVEFYAGGSYGEGSSREGVLVNMPELAINIYQRALVSHNPQCLVDSPVRAFNAVANELTIAMNHLIDREMELGESLNDVVYDALFVQGTMKVGITPKEHDDFEGFRHDSGQPFADPIGFDDWVQDMNVDRWEQIDFCGDRYVVPLEDVMESPLFTNAGKRDLSPYMRDGGDMMDRDESPANLSQNRGPGRSEYHQRVRLWDIWLPRDKVLVTFADNNWSRPLRVVDWDGPESGPYHRLGFSKVPGNCIPLSPMMVWEDIADLINRLAVKAGQQADRQKSILAGQNRTSSAMEAITQTPDGMAITTDVDPNLIKEFMFGGVDPNLMSSIGGFKDLFIYLAGNLDILGGLGPQSQTLGQDRLLSGAASERLNDMRDRVIKFTTRIVEDLAWYLWRDPMIDLPLTKQITPTISSTFRWTPDSREGEFFNYNFKVVPHSLQSRSPQERLQVMMQIVQTVVIPMMPMLQERGIVFDIEEFMRQIAKLSHSPELEKLLVRDTGLSLLGQDAPIDPRQSPVTTRNYVRRDRGGGGGNGPAGQQQQQQFPNGMQGQPTQQRGPYKQPMSA